MFFVSAAFFVVFYFILLLQYRYDLQRLDSDLQKNPFFACLLPLSAFYNQSLKKEPDAGRVVDPFTVGSRTIQAGRIRCWIWIQNDFKSRIQTRNNHSGSRTLETGNQIKNTYFK
jgi:hypothetical protein